MSTNSTDSYPWKEPSEVSKRGAFIVVEGLDRAGKTTQVKKLCDTLYAEGHNVKKLRFPDRTSPIGQMIDSYLRNHTEMDDHAIHLLFSSNRWEKAKWIKEAISAGYTIVCDRYYYSGIVYSAAKKIPSLNLQWARHCDVGLPRPDCVLFLDLEPEEAEKRGRFGEEKYEKQEMQKEVRRLFAKLRKTPAEREDMIVVDAGKGVEKVADKIWEEVKLLLENDLGGELRSVETWDEREVEWLNEKVT